MKSKRKKITGELINFRGLIYAPVNEQGVVFLFGMIAHELGLYVELVRPGYPDCIAKRDIGKGRWEEVKIEFEFRSSNFDHEPSECDMIVCWEHDWKACPEHIEIIELKDEIKKLENVLTKPSNKSQYVDEYPLKIHTNKAGNEARKLFEELDKKIKQIDSSIYYEIGKERILYRLGDETEFADIALRKRFLNIYLITWGKTFEGVQSVTSKWGRIYVRDYSDIPVAITVTKQVINLARKVRQEIIDNK